MALTATTELKLNKLGDWIVDSGASNHMTGDKEKITNSKRYVGNHVGDVRFPGEKNQKPFVMNDVFYVPGMKKNLFPVPQITSTGKYVLFGPNDVRIFEKFETPSIPIIQGKRTETVYVLSAESTYVDKAKQNQNADLLHARLNKEIICAGCQ